NRISYGRSLASTLRRQGKTKSIPSSSRTWKSLRQSQRQRSGLRACRNVWRRDALRRLPQLKPVNSKLGSYMFELDQFVSDCRAALREDAPQRAVREVVSRAVSDPRGVLQALGEPQRAEMQTLYR